MKCWACGKALSLTQIGFREECPHCRTDLHVCKGCVHYEETKYNECREPVAERQREKERANRCEMFVFGGAGGQAGASKEDLLKNAEALFKKKTE